ncbi:circadian clock KaiB family protein [Spirosoma jeollabukense]
MSEPSLREDVDPDGEGQHYVLHLFVTGASSNSTRAITNIKHICEQYLPGNYTLEIIDVYQQKTLAEQEQLIALPLLIKRFPLPERRLIGDLSDTGKVLNGLGLSR